MSLTQAKISEAINTLQAMQPPFEGGCLCGALRYRCTQSPFWSSSCYCRSCQKLTGSACSTAFTINANEFEVLSGRTLEFDRKGGSGDIVKTVRCADCGTWVYAKPENHPEWRGVLASTLDDAERFVLISNVFTSEAPAWAKPDPSVLQFARMPQDEWPED